MAEACIYVMKNSDKIMQEDQAPLLNIGISLDVTIKELSEIIKEVANYKGEIIWDSTKPDGTSRKLLDVSKMKAKGWEAGISLKDGIRKTYEWYIEKVCKESI